MKMINLRIYGVYGLQGWQQQSLLPKWKWLIYAFMAFMACKAGGAQKNYFLECRKANCVVSSEGIQN